MISRAAVAGSLCNPRQRALFAIFSHTGYFWTHLCLTRMT